MSIVCIKQNSQKPEHIVSVLAVKANKPVKVTSQIIACNGNLHFVDVVAHILKLSSIKVAQNLMFTMLKNSGGLLFDQQTFQQTFRAIHMLSMLI